MSSLPSADGLPFPLAEALAAAHRVLGAGAPSSVALALDSLRAEFLTTADTLHPQDLAKIADGGGEARVTFEVGALITTIDHVGSSSPAISVEGPIEEVFAVADDADEFRRAVDSNDAARVLVSLGTRPCTVSLVVRNDPAQTGVVWAPTQAVLLEALTSDRWLAAANTLLKGKEQRGRRVVVIGDAGTALLTCSGLLFTGPPATAAIPDDRHPRTVTTGPDGLPSPEHFAPETAHERDDRLNDLRAALNRLVIDLVWLSLADERTAAAPPQIVLRGVREQRVVLGGPPTDAHPEAALRLWRWAGGGSDPAKHEAIQQAATFAISGEADLEDAAEPVLRTAKSLYELARRGAIGEALATRRAAREAAQGTAREAARAARETAARAVERSVLVALGVAGAALAKTQDLISTSQAAFTLVLLAAIVALSALVAFASELAVGRQAISTFRADADSYREALSKADVEALKQSASLTRASSSLKTASWLVGLTHALVLFGILIAAWQAPAWSSKAPRSPSPTASPPVPAATTSPTAASASSQPPLGRTAPSPASRP